MLCSSFQLGSHFADVPLVNERHRAHLAQLPFRAWRLELAKGSRLDRDAVVA